MSSATQPPVEFQVRPATLDDLAAVYRLRAACDVADFGEALLTEEQLRDRWHTPGFDLARDAWVATAAGVLVGYGEARGAGEQAWVRVAVSPERRSEGIGARLLRLAEARATEITTSNTREVLTQVSDRDSDLQRLLEQAGYVTDLAFRIMAITFAAPPPAPEWPRGVAVRSFEVGRDERATYAADEEASVDKGYHRALSFGEWSERMGLGRVDPALWFLAWEDAEVAGVALNYVAPATGIGWVEHLGVRRPWRGRGLGLALLHHAFGAFYARGVRQVRLSVDDQSRTGATRLYERAGMSTIQHYHIYRKALR